MMGVELNVALGRRPCGVGGKKKKKKASMS